MSRGSTLPDSPAAERADASLDCDYDLLHVAAANVARTIKQEK
jgi:hypothetical protein